jgi:tRNA-specific 2-thiouridylase
MPRVVVGLSGGVDSSVAAYLLKKEGYDVMGVFMINWHDKTGTLEGDCPWKDDLIFAQLVAKKLQIPFYSIDLSKEYRKRVVDYMFHEYEKGRTPNPDVLCNREIKFDEFLKATQQFRPDFVATGHYCRKEVTKLNGHTVHRLLAGKDQNKEQSYFLCQISQDQLGKALFPVGELLKEEVREIAREQELPTADKKDSQGICFIGKVDLPTFLQQRLEAKQGDVIEIPRRFTGYLDYKNKISHFNEMFRYDDSDNATDHSPVTDYDDTPDQCLLTNSDDATDHSPVADSDDTTDQSHVTDSVDPIHPSGSPFPVKPNHLIHPAQPADISQSLILDTITEPFEYQPEDGIVTGQHRGAHFFTIGQRKGLNVGGKKEPLFVIATDTKRNIVYTGQGKDHPGLFRKGLFIQIYDIHWIREDLKMKPGDTRKMMVRIRYRQPLQKASLFMKEKGMYIIFERMQRGVTPGQFAAWYDGEELLGSGCIS